jgi:hypothetical protein
MMRTVAQPRARVNTLQPNSSNWSAHGSTTLYQPHTAPDAAQQTRAIPSEVIEHAMPTALTPAHAQILSHHFLHVLPSEARHVRFNVPAYGPGGVVRSVTTCNSMIVTIPLARCMELGVNACAVHRGEPDEVSNFVRTLLAKIGCKYNRVQYAKDVNGRSLGCDWTLFLHATESKSPQKPDFTCIPSRM